MGASPAQIVPVAMFVLWAGILGNALLGASIMVYSIEWHELRYHLPWLAGRCVN
jgi:hypothetical protein